MKSVGFARLAAVLSFALAVGCGSDETDDGSNGPSGGGGEGGNGVGAGPTSSSGTPASSSSSSGAGASGGENVGGSAQGGSGGVSDGGAGVGGMSNGGAGGDTNGGAGVGGDGGGPGGETCGNGIDDDADTFADCADSDCDNTAYCTQPVAWDCPDGYFNEAGDGSPTSYICDCECGAHDPDCDLPSTGNVYCDGTPADDGETCSAADVCLPPAAWICAQDAYDEVENGIANPECDCVCGAPDPDCEDVDLPVAGCMVDETCGVNGTCVGAPPLGWICQPAFYNEVAVGSANPLCDCDCGVVDPDCSDPALDVAGCDTGETCSSTGTCVPAPPPATWTCLAVDYNEVGNGVANPECNCGCGAKDPDCEDDLLPETGCAAGDTCSSGVVCVPPAWVCLDLFFNDLLQGNSTVYCDCECGMHDPDCDLPAAALDGLYCGDSPAMSGQMCNAADMCIP